MNENEALAYLREVLDSSYDLPVGVGTVEVTYTDDTTRVFERIRYDANRMEQGFLVMEDDAHDVRVYHVPNVAFWEVIY